MEPTSEASKGSIGGSDRSTMMRMGVGLSCPEEKARRTRALGAELSVRGAQGCAATGQSIGNDSSTGKKATWFARECLMRGEAIVGKGGSQIRFGETRRTMVV